MSEEPEKIACQPAPVAPDDFSASVVLPYGLTVEHVRLAMSGFTDFLGFMNNELYRNGIERLESMMMPANFSTLVSEFMSSNIPRHCPGLAKNQYHNGHPDLVPADTFPNNSVQYAHDGVEIKSSRYSSGWQGHNPEDVWLMVFVYDSNRPRDMGTDVAPRTFRFLGVFGADRCRIDKERLEIFGPICDQSPHHHGGRQRLRLPKDVPELDLQGTCSHSRSSSVCAFFVASGARPASAGIALPAIS